MAARAREELCLAGVVQGIGLRPWAARRARVHGLAGGIANATDGVCVTLEGEPAAIEAWLADLSHEPPPGLRVERLERRSLPPAGERDFRILPSAAAGPAAGLPPDIPMCRTCLDEIYAGSGRRAGYAFTHCAGCGPRASVLRALPWDRERTTLAPFLLCADCRREYEDPKDRRHHAEGIACPACGPTLVACDATGRVLAGPHEAGAAGGILTRPTGAHGAVDGVPAADPVARALAVIAAGGIVAIKGYGGFHLALDATNEEAVSRLRKRKRRPAKPLALLVPDLETARAIAELSDADEALLTGPLRPVVVAPKRPDGCATLGLAPSVAPTTSDHGLLLPSAPVHYLLLRAPPGDSAPRPSALVFTSANRSGEPTLWEDAEAMRELASVADLFLTHDRAVARPCDDSVFRTSARGAIPMRLSRGAAPLVLRAPGTVRTGACVLAIGGDLKTAPALAIGPEIVLETHVGDLESPATADAALERALRLCRERGVRPERVVHDLHPGYVGTRLAAELATALGAETLAVQHHHAHALAAAVEHDLDAPFLAIVLDGLGFGGDGTLWGGEILAVDGLRAERAAHLETLHIPGGDAAAREPWRSAASWLARAFPDGDAPRLPWNARQEASALALLAHAAERGLNAPETSSCGRFFDAVASLLDCGDRSSFEGETAIAFEALAAAAPAMQTATAAEPDVHAERADAEVAGHEVGSSAAGSAIPCADLVRDLVLAASCGEPRAVLACRFHDALAARLTARAAMLATERGLRTIVLSGGCLQNRLLADALVRGLEARGLVPLTHRRLPPNDGSLAVGQASYGLR